MNLIVFNSFGQNIEAITIEVEGSNEPPTKRKPSKYKIKFIRNQDDGLSAKYYTKSGKKHKLKNKVFIKKGYVSRFIKWKETNKKSFNLDEFGLNLQTLNQKAQTSKYVLNYPFSKDFQVRVDSFYFCKDYQLLKTMIIGGYSCKIFIEVNGEKQEYFSKKGGNNLTIDINLKNYLFLYPLLKNKLPSEFPNYSFFSEDNLINVLIFYKKITECEDYYYSQYVKENPKRTAQEVRVKKSWDFKKYLEDKSK